MARFIRASQKIFLVQAPSSPQTLMSRIQKSPLRQIRNSFHASLFQTRNYISEMRKSTIEGNLLRILRNEIQYECDYSPPIESDKEFDYFSIEDRKGEQWIRLRGKYGDKEEIKIEVTMFDGAVPAQKSGGGDDVKLHISLIVEISKGEGCDVMQFICSAWPDSLEIQKVFMLRRNGMTRWPYMGPDFKELDDELQKELQEYLEERGVNDELTEFLHVYMMNKDKSELINWMENVKGFVDK